VPPITVPSIVPPSMSGVFTSGLVSVLFVKVCVPVRVATVESIASVTVLPVAELSRPVPPAIVNVSLSKSIAIVPLSVVMSKVFCSNLCIYIIFYCC
jgi:hypothetical protein